MARSARTIGAPWPGGPPPAGRHAALRALDGALLGATRSALDYWPSRYGRGTLHRIGRAAALRLGPTRATTRYGGTMLCDGVDLVQRNVLFAGLWEPALSAFVARTLREGDVFVDVGANVGWFTLLAANVVGPDGGCVAMEAAPATADRLEANLALNGMDRVRVVRSAVLDRHGRVRLYLAPERNAGANTTLPSRGHERFVEVEAAPLPDLLTEDEMRRARIVKIDVEGAERAVIGPLLGAMDRFREDLVVVVEFARGALHHEGTSLAAEIERFRAHGFAPHYFDREMPGYDYVRERAPVSGEPIALDAEPEGTLEALAARPHVDIAFMRPPAR